MPTENCFTTPIYHALVEDFDTIQQEFKTAINATSFKRNDHWDHDTHLMSDPKFVTSLINLHNLKSFEKELDNHIKQYAKSINLTRDVDTYEIAQSWLTLTQPGQYAHRHSHGYSDISGVYYIKSSGNDGDFWAEHPLNQLFETSYFYSHTPEKIYIKPHVGRLILFPSWLKHGVNKNTTNADRISFSFNIFFNRTLHLNKINYE
jgi:uncharacterized protein (TIGR02466 family)